MDFERRIPELIKRGSNDIEALTDAFELVRLLEMEDAVYISGNEDVTKHDENNFNLAHTLVKDIRTLSAQMVKRGFGTPAVELNKRCLLFDAPYDFDAAIRYAEWNREPRRKFYEPRRKQLLPIVRAMEDLDARRIRTLGIMCPPGVGKSTTGIMFMIWTGMRHPDMSILGGSHSNSFLRGVYDEIVRMIEPDSEYLWWDIFPELGGKYTTYAKDMRVDIGRPKRFQTFEFSSIGSGNAGKVRASNLLYCDDLVDGIESAMSRDRMDKLWQQYYTDLRQRKIGDCVELHIATPWSLHDPMDRLEEMNEGNPQAKFIHMPALNEDDESNFDYPYGVGFTTAFFHEQREIMDDASWKALYMTQPVERGGVLYDSQDLKRYFHLPDAEPDAVIAVCDTKNSGADYCVMPIAYKYGKEYYIETCICDNSAPEIVEQRLVDALVAHEVKAARFESNSAGGRVAETVQKRVNEKGGFTHITTKWNQSHKETRIVLDSPWVKQHCLFKDDSVIRSDKEYRRMLQMLTSYSLEGKNKHDDVPDAFSMLANFAQNITGGVASVVKRLF